MDNIQIQGGDNYFNRSFYQLIFNYIKDGDILLNLGCGANFNFEKGLLEAKRVKIVSCDILNLTVKPDFIFDYVRKSVEEKIDLVFKFNVVTFFELIEHIDKTDELLKNCINNLEKDGLLIFSFPNLASIYSRIELLFGFHPHVLEISNVYANFGTGIFGKLNNQSGETLHHLRGITNRAMSEMVNYYGFSIVKKIGYEYRFKKLFYFFPGIAPINIFICKKNI